MKKNGGKLPPGYKSAFYKWKERQPKPIAPMIDAEDLEEFPETDLAAPLWCISQCAISAEPMCQVCDDPSSEHPNIFSALLDEEEDEDDDESKDLNAIGQFSAKITVGPKLS